MGVIRGVVVTFLSVALAGCGREVTVLSYNVRNLFDVSTDGTEYSARSTPDAAAFREKCELISGAIRDACRGGPDIVALQEVEGLAALTTLRDGWLRGMGYHYLVVAEGPATAVRVGFLSRWPIHGARTHLPSSAADEIHRAILEIECRPYGVPLYVFNNHWKSRIGGSALTEPARIRSARVVARRVRELMAADPFVGVVVLGDLNEGPIAEVSPSALSVVTDETASVIELSVAPGAPAPTGPGLELYDPWLEPDASPGSYVFGDRWEAPDHLLLSPGLLEGCGLLYTAGSFRVVAPTYLVDPVSGHPVGAGSSGRESAPDHLPLLIRLSVRS